MRLRWPFRTSFRCCIKRHATARIAAIGPSRAVRICGPSAKVVQIDVLTGLRDLPDDAAVSVGIAVRPTEEGRAIHVSAAVERHSAVRDLSVGALRAVRVGNRSAKACEG